MATKKELEMVIGEVRGKISGICTLQQEILASVHEAREDQKVVVKTIDAHTKDDAEKFEAIVATVAGFTGKIYGGITVAVFITTLVSGFVYWYFNNIPQ